MKLFGDSPKKPKHESKEGIPAPKDKSRRKRNYPAGEEIQEEYLDEEQEEYDEVVVIKAMFLNHDYQ